VPQNHIAQRSTPRKERFWALDLCVVILACLVIYVAVDRLSFSDDRWLYNTWTYVLSVPISACLLAFFSHSLISKHAQKSIQIGLFFSLLLHLILFVVAINVVIFHQYLPNSPRQTAGRSFKGQKTLPDNLFSPKQTQEDWSTPVASSIHAKPIEELNDSQREPGGSPLRAVQIGSTSDGSKESVATSPELRFAENTNPVLNGKKRIAKIKNQFQATDLSLDNEPVVPTITPAEESIIGSFERQLSTSILRVAPITSQMKAPVSKTPRLEKTTELPEIVTAQEAPKPPRINSLIGVREGLKNAQTKPKPLNINDPPAGIALTPIETTTTLSSRVIPNDSDRPMNPDSGLATRGMPPTFQNQNQSPKTAMNEVQTRLGSIVGRQDPISPLPTAREVRAKLSTGSSYLRGTSSNPEPILNAFSSTEKEKRNISSSPNTLERSAGITGREDTPQGAMLEPSTTNRMKSRTFTDTKISLTNKPSKENDPQIVDLSTPRSLPSIASIRQSRPLSTADSVRSPFSLPKPEITPAPSFTQRVLRIADSNPMEKPANPAPSADTEDAIELGLTYLASTQNSDGSWSLQGHGLEVILHSDTAATGLALLAFQGAGYTHQRDAYATTVRRGLEFLIENQTSDGNLFRPEDQISNQNVAFYSHGIASLALCEAFGMTKDVSLETPAQLALNYISNTQHRQRGGWRYNPQVSSDTSVSGWMMMALKSGELAGLQTNAKTYRGISFWLSLAQSDEKADRYRYNPFAPDTPTQRHGRLASPTMTAVAALMRMYAGWTRETPELQSIATYLLEYPPQVGSTDNPMRDTYYWYYATQVMFHMGGSHWKTWNQKLNPILVESQTKTGPLAGSWDPRSPVPDRWSAHAGRIYVTAMNLLNLEVYYRHLPIYEQTGNNNQADITE